MHLLKTVGYSKQSVVTITTKVRTLVWIHHCIVIMIGHHIWISDKYFDIYSKNPPFKKIKNKKLLSSANINSNFTIFLFNIEKFKFFHLEKYEKQFRTNIDNI